MIDRFLDRQMRPDYNCLDFVREVWAELTGKDITEELSGLLRNAGGSEGHRRPKGSYKRLESPANPCLVLMQRNKTAPHIGIYLNRRILHLHKRGVEFQPLVVAREYFKIIGYYQ